MFGINKVPDTRDGERKRDRERERDATVGNWYRWDTNENMFRLATIYRIISAPNYSRGIIAAHAELLRRFDHAIDNGDN